VTPQFSSSVSGAIALLAGLVYRGSGSLSLDGWLAGKRSDG